MFAPISQSGAAAPDMPEPDDLLDCLLVVARSHGQAVTREAILAGLPVQRQRLSPMLMARAAGRAHLGCELVRSPLPRLNDALLPAILLLRGDKACVLLSFSEDRASVRVAYPHLGDTAVRVAVEDLEAEYTGICVYLRPLRQFDDRAPAARDSGQAHWFWSVIRESRPLYRDVLLAALLANLFALGMPLFVMNVYDRVVPNQAMDTLWVLALGLLVMLVGDLVLRTMRVRFIDLASARSDIKLSARIMERVLGMRMEQRPASAGSFAANLRAFETVRDFIGSATVTAFVDLPFGLLFMVVIGWLAWPLVLPIVLGAVLTILYAVAVQARMQELSETSYRASAQRNATLVEGLVGFETLKALGAEGVMQRRWEEGARLLARVGTQLRLLSSATVQGAAFGQQVVSLSVVVLGVYLIADNALTLGGLIASTMLASRAMAPIGAVAGLLVQYHAASTALGSLDTLMQCEVERPQDKRYLARGSLQGAIEFRDVSFTYPGQAQPALRSVSLRIQPGERVGILGRIGSGKSTLEKLILGLYQPTEGAVLVDGIDLRQLDPAHVRRQMGWVQQDVTLFYGTLRENIAMGAPLAADADVIRAAEVAGLLPMVNAHPRGFDMPIGERGESLSGGQRQGVAIARAVINDPPILLLDEPTAAADHSSEEDIKRRLGEFARDRTLVIVTHRASLLELVDRIIVLDGGRVVADGPRERVVSALRQGRVGKAAP